MVATVGYSAETLAALTAAAQSNPRLRSHMNIHRSYEDPCQRLLNAVEPGSYIRPHRHPCASTNETLLAVRGRFLLAVFDDHGVVIAASAMGPGWGDAVLCELPPDVWHTAISLESGSVLFEAKAGPFDPDRAKAFAPFAPEEGAPAASGYLREVTARAIALISEKGGLGRRRRYDAVRRAPL